ncbi:MAG: hypothetical protein IEMM0008_0292 [bacterium]|nr:MAG: hypothetical protein IEMM0008_0292 [bacterium]
MKIDLGNNKILLPCPFHPILSIIYPKVAMKKRDISFINIYIHIITLVILLSSCQNGNANKSKNHSNNSLFDTDSVNSLGMDHLKRFYAKLSALNQGQINKVRILQFGDSHTACDWMTGELRRLFSKRFGSGGPGFIHVAKPWSWYYHTLVDVQTRKLRIHNPEELDDSPFIRFIKNPFDVFYQYLDGNSPVNKKRDDGWTHYRSLFSHKYKDRRLAYGLGGVRSVGNNTKSTIQCREGDFDHIELWYHEKPKRGQLILSVNQQHKLIPPDSRLKPRIRRFIYELPSPEKELSIEIKGENSVTLYGMVLESSKRGIVFDTLGLDGAKIEDLLRQDWDKTLKTQLAWRQPDLIILAYGTNSLYDPRFHPKHYQHQFRSLIQTIQRATRHSVDILVLGPPDKNILIATKRRKAKDWVTPPRLKEIVEAQITASMTRNVAFINPFALMGGEGSMKRFVQKKLGQKDHTHFTKRGYQKMAQEIYAILMKHYDENR